MTVRERVVITNFDAEKNHTSSSTPKRKQRASSVEAFGVRCSVSVCSADGACVGGDTWPKLGTLLGDWTGDTRALHFAFGIDNHAGVVLEVEEMAFSSADGLALADDDCGHDFLTKFGFTFLD